ncbi:MAG: rhodanese-like domain-containing protein [Prolixibacteraceae bacterium]|jgi:rhodanese-related sulfurtransferase
MHVHELNPWRTLIALCIFIAILIVGFVTMRTPLLTYKLDMNQSIDELKKADACFYPWQLNSFITNETKDVVVFDIRDNFVFGQGHIPGAENLSAQDLTREESIERLEDLKDQNITVVLYGEDQLQANGPWMLFRQAGFDNVKVLLGGYRYYVEHKDNLVATKNDSTFQKEIPRYDFAAMASPKGGSAISTSTENKPVVVTKRKKASAASGGC